MNRTLLLIGPYPEPKGGVSIHLQRLSELMVDDYNILQIDESPIVNNDIFNIRSLNVYKYMRLIVKSNIVHVQSSIDILRIFHVIISKISGKRIILTIHSWRNKSIKQTWLLKLCLKCVDKIIVVNTDIAQELDLKEYSVQPAFLPPGIEELEDIPKDLKDIVQTKKKNGFFIVSSNAYQLAEHNGEDLYGLDLFIDLVEAYRDEKIFFVFQLASFGNGAQKEKYKRYVKLIRKKKIDNILIYVNPISFVALINESDMTLRLTNTDGDALSIRESLYLNTPIISSDIVERPRGTILYKNRDIEGLKKVFHDTYGEIINDVEDNQDLKDTKQTYIDFYKKIYFEQEKK